MFNHTEVGDFSQSYFEYACRQARDFVCLPRGVLCKSFMTDKLKLIRTSTVPTSLKTFLAGSIEPLMSRYDLVLVSSPDKELDELREQYGVKTIGVRMERRMSPLKDLRSLWRLTCVFRRERPYMVHSMTPKAGLLCMLAAWVARVPRRVHTFTGLVWPTATGLSRRILMFTDWLTCACATHIIPEGRGVMNDLQQHITRKPMRVLGYGNVRGVDMDYWSRDNADAELVHSLREENTFTFVFVGRIVRDKGINELVKAFKRVREEHNVRLVLVGRFEDSLDPISDESRKTIKECDDIVYAGSQFGRDLLAYYAAADCFVFPSYREGFPNTVLEAGAMGLPSIVTDINGSREIIENGKNGIIVPSKDADALAEAMSRMVEDTDMQHLMARNARPMIASRFEQGFVRKCQMDFYDEIV